MGDFSTETFQARRNWHKIFKVMKSKDLQPRLLYPISLSFKIEREIKNFPDKKKLKEFVTTNKVLQKMLKGDFQSRWQHRQTWLAFSHNHIKITTKR